MEGVGIRKTEWTGRECLVSGGPQPTQPKPLLTASNFLPRTKRSQPLCFREHAVALEIELVSENERSRLFEHDVHRYGL